jgi:lysozyme
MDKSKLITQLRLHEGVKNKVYRDILGIETIGVGRNLEDKGLSDDEIDYLLENDIKDVEKDLKQFCRWWEKLDEVRQRAIADLVFNMGITRFLTFKKTINHLQNERFVEAGDELLNSRYAEQVGVRAERISEMIRYGKDVIGSLL